MDKKLKIEKQKIIKETGIRKLFFDVGVSRLTSLGVGGLGFCLAIADSRDELRRVLTTCLKHRFGFIVIGDGTNIVVNDAYIDLVFIKLGKEFDYIRLVDHGNILAGASCKLSKLVMKASILGFDFSFLSGIPGTVGGAIVGNSGDKSQGICSSVRKLSGFFLENGSFEEKTIEITSKNFGYRFFDLPGLLVLTDILLEPEKLSSELVLEKIRTKIDERRRKQPLKVKNAGCFFKNPSYFSKTAGELIEECGLKGFIYGGARVSFKHANFIENFRNATAKDVVDLSRIIMGMVAKNFGLRLEYEVKMVGF